MIGLIAAGDASGGPRSYIRSAVFEGSPFA